MVFFQSLIFGLTTTAYSIVNLYVSVMASTATNTYQTAVYNLLSNVFAYIALTGPCMSFYLFTLSSKLFRRQLKILFLRGGIIRGRPERVQPTNYTLNL